VIRETFEAELAKQGLKSQMPPRVYTDRSFVWYDAREQDRGAPQTRSNGSWV